VHRRVQAGRIKEHRELGRVAVEVALEHAADPPDGAVALGLVEQLVDHRPKRPVVPEELLERARQPAVAVREVRPKRLLERRRGLLVDLLGLAQHALELGLHDVDVDADAGILEGDQSDANGSLDQHRTILGRSLTDIGGKAGVIENEAVDDDPVPQDLDPGTGRRVGWRRQRDERSGFHDPNGAAWP
jgi:hypothetical protein